MWEQRQQQMRMPGQMRLGEGRASQREPDALPAGVRETPLDIASDVFTPETEPEMRGHLPEMYRQRAHARQMLREFLRAVPRSEEGVRIEIPHPDGTMRAYTRGELSLAIDRLRPRQRQILRLAVEERWPRQRVCEYLHNISMKTLERDQVEGLDILLDMHVWG